VLALTRREPGEPSNENAVDGRGLLELNLELHALGKPDANRIPLVPPPAKHLGTTQRDQPRALEEDPEHLDTEGASAPAFVM
jgi:hypothetical protein